MFTGTLQGCAFWPWACQHYFVSRRNFHWPHAGSYSVHYFIFWGSGDRGGFWLCGVASLVMYCIDASLRLWLNPCTGLLHPFLWSVIKVTSFFVLTVSKNPPVAWVSWHSPVLLHSTVLLLVNNHRSQVWLDVRHGPRKGKRIITFSSLVPFARYTMACLLCGSGSTKKYAIYT